jgi:DMSO/TMAO reductase YedYZ molybdopterin-dependent catalytic subunit
MAVTTHEGLTREELQLATRNHGMPLEALRYDLTPAGLHYLLVHYDIPDVDPVTWALDVDGEVGRPLRLGLAELMSMPSCSVTATMECAGNGRARLHPRPVSQPWLFEAVGTAEWTGVRVTDLLDRAGLGARALEVVFTGMDRGVESGAEQWYQRSLPLADVGADAVLAWAMNGHPLLPQHGSPLRLVVPGWYGMTNVKWLSRMTLVTEPFASASTSAPPDPWFWPHLVALSATSWDQNGRGQGLGREP